MLDAAKPFEQQLQSAFPALYEANQPTLRDFYAQGIRTRLDSGQFICLEGGECATLAFLVSGTVRVYKTNNTGRELTLYRLAKGESCILTVSCILNRSPFPAIAVAESQIEAVAVPAGVLREWVDRHHFWRRYVFDLLAKRLSTVIGVVEEVAFRRMDVRIGEYLLKLRSPANDRIPITHQRLAAELGTSREVVSRLLKDFEQRGWIRLARNSICILDPTGIKSMVETRL